MKNLILMGALLMGILSSSLVKAQYQPYIGQIMFAPYTNTPTGWAECNGQLLSIAQNTALFSLLGTTFGGNGQTTFALPDMRGRSLIHPGTGPGLTPVVLGQVGGVESVTLTTAQMPLHTHTVAAVSTEGNQNSPTNNLPADTKALDKEYSDAAGNTQMKNTMISPAGGSQPHENRPPYLAVKCYIALQGVFPSFN
ncbi:phage tail protein [Chryseobacterium caseinilyticum]|uniref:Phage tail protein n=1 Tax=Chryseobacterium caseinilyticum TaxID=2771428 RepID=A0ABR8ZEJ9_9FLAO|nr:tail fiber protein [Chryseobacterium caseinilyticum]MBD8083700.1 phage tail protein [Chryseobacterium caseinilyticum]